MSSQELDRLVRKVQREHDRRDHRLSDIETAARHSHEVRVGKLRQLHAFSAETASRLAAAEVAYDVQLHQFVPILTRPYHPTRLKELHARRNSFIAEGWLVSTSTNRGCLLVPGGDLYMYSAVSSNHEGVVLGRSIQHWTGDAEDTFPADWDDTTIASDLAAKLDHKETESDRIDMLMHRMAELVVSKTSPTAASSS